MTTARLTNPSLTRREPPHFTVRARTRISESPPDAEPAIAAPFEPLDRGIVSEAVPAFFIGRNAEGFWVAREASGKIGGVFLFKTSAASFARKNSRAAGCATIFPSEKFELDLENKGNPSIAHLGRLRRLATGHSQRMSALLDKTARALRSMLNNRHIP
jgi:hypothetical protein